MLESGRSTPKPGAEPLTSAGKGDLEEGYQNLQRWCDRT